MSEPTPVPAPAAAAAPAAPVAPVAPTPEALPSERCPNCLAPLQGPFCFACGQSKKGLIRHFSSILGDFADSVLQLDNRTWRTLGPLYFKPGYLSNEYFAGRRVRYVTPLRLYFFLSLIAFLIISAVSGSDFVVDDNGVRIGAGVEAQKWAALTPEERLRKIAEIDEALKWVPAKAREEARADMLRELGATEKPAAAPDAPPDARRQADEARRSAQAVKKGKRDNDDEPTLTLFDDKPWHRKDNPLVISWLPDAANEAINDEIGILIRKIRRIRDDPQPFVKQMFSTAPQTLFVILPVFALLLKIFFIFKRRLYMEHLIVALHSHSFICFSLILLVVLNLLQDWVAPESGFARALWALMIGLTCAWIPLYLLLMQKRVYKQNWFLTLFKYGLIGITYLFLLIFGTLLTMLVSLVLL